MFSSFGLNAKIPVLTDSASEDFYHQLDSYKNEWKI